MADESQSERALLYIEEKEDSQQKLAKVAGKPRKNYLFAPEFNAVKRAVNLLHNFMSMTASTVMAVVGNDKLDLGELGDLEDMDFIDYINIYDPAVQLGVTGANYVTFTENNLLRVYAYVGAPAYYGTGQTTVLSPVQMLALYIQPETEANTQRVFLATIDSLAANDFSGFFCHDDQIKDITWSFPEAGRLRATSPSFADRRKVMPRVHPAFGPRAVYGESYDGYVDFIGVNLGSGGSSGTYSSFQGLRLEIILFNNAWSQVQNPE